MQMTGPNLEPHEPQAPEPCVCGCNCGERITCPECGCPLCEECLREACGECREIVCPAHLRLVPMGARNVAICGSCWERLVEDGEACGCDERDCDTCREQARRRERREMERDAEAEVKYADGMVEVLS